MKQKIKQNIKWIIMFIAIIIFAELTEDVFEKEIFHFDKIIYQWISYTIQDPVTNVFKIITNLGSAIPIITICVSSFCFFKNKKYGTYISLNLICIVILNQLLKHIIQRPRPTEHRIIDETGYSFPSGHSMVSMAFYGFLIYLIYQYIENKYWKYFLCVILSVLILFIGISRIYLGVHYPSDVVGGFCFSIAYLILYINIIKNQIEK